MGLVAENGDYQFAGAIVDYRLDPASISAGLKSAVGAGAVGDAFSGALTSGTGAVSDLIEGAAPNAVGAINNAVDGVSALGGERPVPCHDRRLRCP